MAPNIISAALARLRSRWSGHTGSGLADGASSLRLSTRQMLDEHLMRDIGLLQGRLPTRHRKTFLDI